MTRDLADYYHWEERGRGVRIYMESGAADRLQADVLGSSGASAAGGILLGRVEPDGELTATIIEDFVAVPGQANPEAALLRAALAGCQTGAPSIVGYYRGHYRDGLSVGPEDVELIEGYLPAPRSLFLLIKHMGNRGCTAGFFFWEDGRFQGEFSLMEVALGRMAALPVEDGEFHSPGRISNPPEVDNLPHKSFWRDFLLRAAIVSLAAVTVVLSVLIYLGAPRSSLNTAAAATLGLRVERKGADLLVSWDRRERAASLFIRDGGKEKALILDTGSVLYTPVSDDIQFRLEVVGVGEQSVRVLLPK